jgi:alanyl-tRNA synthetase
VNLKRAANTQKCIRAGGKHNDLEDVGKDVYHHTFFEMLGNWSFGDYFKKEAIEWAWELLTKVYGLDGSRLYATYFEGDAKQGLPVDDEARELWLRFLPADHILPGNAKDNFWEMGETGPCGPCSELHYDRIGGGRNAAHRVNKDDPDVLEIWNLVFMQYQRQDDRSLRKLPAAHVDTGMGFERLVSVIHDVRSNYDTPIFGAIFDEIQRLTKCRPYTGKVGKEDTDAVDMAYRVIADHIRTLCIAIADGSGPGPVGREYVLRRILRRAVRYWNEVLKASKGSFTQLVPCVTKSLAFFTELADKQEYIIKVIAEEEARFERTLHRGTVRFNRLADKAKKSGVISGADVWDLWSTFGFPVDLTELMADEKGLKLDKEGLEKIRNAPPSEQKKQDKNALALDVQATAQLQKQGIVSTDDSAKFEAKKAVRGTVVALFDGKEFVQAAKGGKAVGVILDKTNFYAEAGGQVADIGELVVAGASSDDDALTVTDTQRYAGYIVHSCALPAGASLAVGSVVDAFVDLTAREPIMANHTATHVLNHALLKVLGSHVDQKGSLVDADRARFDFSHKVGVTDDELARIEDSARAQIASDLPVYAQVLPLDKAMSINSLRAVFGEKYPDPVRVISVGRPIEELVARPSDPSNFDYSVELCGGTHLSRAGEAKLFCITSEIGVSQGVRRIIAVTGAGAERVLNNSRVVKQKIVDLNKESEKSAKFETAVGALQQFVNQTMLPARDVVQFRQQIQELVDRVVAVRNARVEYALGRAKELAAAVAADAAQTVVVAEVACGSDRNALSKAVVSLRETCPQVAFLLASRDEESVIIMTSAPKGGKVHAGEWAKAAAALVGGKGGGSADSGQASGTKPDGVPGALEAAKEWAGKK